MKDKIEAILNLFPEVTWDRWAGEFHAMGIFGWINRDDGRSDFIVLRIVDGVAVSFSTSSAEYSAEFSRRLDFTHSDCKRVEHDFPGVNAVRQKFYLSI